MKSFFVETSIFFLKKYSCTILSKDFPYWWKPSLCKGKISHIFFVLRRSENMLTACTKLSFPPPNFFIVVALIKIILMLKQQLFALKKFLIEYGANEKKPRSIYTQANVLISLFSDGKYFFFLTRLTRKKDDAFHRCRCVISINFNFKSKKKKMRSKRKIQWGIKKLKHILVRHFGTFLMMRNLITHISSLTLEEGKWKKCSPSKSIMIKNRLPRERWDEIGNCL